MPSRLKEAAAARLARQAAGDFGVLPTEATKYQAIQPDAAAYNVYSPGYAASLAADTGTPAANILNQRALGVKADQESQAYMMALQAAQANQEKLQRQAGVINDQDLVLKHELDPNVNPTIGTVDVGTDQSGMPYIMRDKAATSVINAENMNSEFAGRVKDLGAGVKDMASAGYIVNPDTIAGYMTPAGQEKPAGVDENYTPIKLDNGQVVQMLPPEVNNYITALAAGKRADAAMIAARAAQLRAEKGGSSGAKTVITYDPEGHLASTTVTSPGADPPDLYEPNPNAVERSSGSTAKPSAASLPPVDLEEAKKVVAKFGTVTSGARTVEHNREVGGVKNSFHIDYGHGGHAIDFVPHKGVTEEQVVANLHEKGFTTGKPLNEGDHIHIAITGRSKRTTPSVAAATPQRRPVPGGQQRAIQLAQAKGYKVTQNGANVVIHLPSGQTTTVAPDGSFQ